MKFYVADGVFAVDADQEAITLAHELMKLYDSVHFRFAKFLSNSKEVMSHIPQDRRIEDINFEENLPESAALGLHYDPVTECLNINPVKELAQKITKAEVMRLAGLAYDPNNYLAPITINVRRLTQKIFQIPTILFSGRKITHT